MACKRRNNSFHNCACCQVRGIPVDHWQTCLKVNVTNSTFTLDYYYDKNGTYSIDGRRTAFPVRAVVKGSGP